MEKIYDQTLRSLLKHEDPIVRHHAEVIFRQLEAIKRQAESKKDLIKLP